MLFCFVLFSIIRNFALAIRLEALIHTEVCGAAGWSTTY